MEDPYLDLVTRRERICHFMGQVLKACRNIILLVVRYFILAMQWKMTTVRIVA